MASARKHNFTAPRTLMLVAFLVTMSGCAPMALMQSPDPLGDLKQARADQDYDRALYIAEHLDADHPDHDQVQSLLPQLRTEIENFEQNIINEANKLAKQQKWDQVWQLLADSMDQWRPSAALRQARKRLRKREEYQRRKTTGDLLLAETRWRLSSSELAGRLANYTDAASENRYEQWRKRHRELAETLVDQGRWFSEREDWQRAHDYLSSARALHADVVPETLFARVQEKHQSLSRRSRAQRERRQRRQARQRREQARSLLEQYRNSGELDDLLQLRALIRKDSDGYLPEQLTAQVEILSRERFRTAMNEGDARYARGDYREARAIWQKVKPLAPPDSELPEKLERVERVLEKLQNLQSSKD